MVLCKLLLKDSTFSKGAASDEVPKDYRYKLHLEEVAEVWRRGSVVSSWLLDLLAIALSEDPLLSKYVGYVHDSGDVLA